MTIYMGVKCIMKQKETFSYIARFIATFTIGQDRRVCKMSVVLLCLQALLCVVSALPRDGGLITEMLKIQEDEKRGTDAQIVAVFRSNAGDGIKLRTSETSLVLTTADEQTTLVNVSVIPLVVQSYGDEGKATYFQIMNDDFLSVNKRVYRIPDSKVDKASFTHSELVASVQGELLNNPQNTIRASVQRLVAHPAMRLLEPAAKALAEDLGVTGYEEPRSTLFFASAMRLTELYSRQNFVGVAFRPSGDVPQFLKLFATAQGRYPNCDLTTCPPCQEDECLGLCGRLCSCWRFLCGDCCFHQGCLLHDLCCDEYGFFSVQCLFPVGFSCDNYKC